MKNNIYLYPMQNEADLKVENPYIYNLSQGLMTRFNVLNYGKNMMLAVLDISLYFKDADFLYFNWVENISVIKVPFFLFFVGLAKLFNKKIVWAHHNKHPHRQNKLGNWLMKFLTKRSDYIVFHTKESYPLLQLKEDDKRVVYFFHPFFSTELQPQTTPKEYDLLIWGTVRKSKGIDTFLEFLKENDLLNRYKIKVAGKFANDLFYQETVEKYLSEKLSIENKYLDENDLQHLHERARFVFFPYTGTSVLNSGALVTSMPYGTPVIGPNTGAFKEMGEAGFIQTYDTFDDVLKKLDDKNSGISQRDELQRFITDHNWPALGDVLFQRLVSASAKKN